MHEMTRLNGVAKWTVIMHMYMYIYTHVCTCTHMRTSTGKCFHKQMCMYVRAEAHTVRPICMYMYMGHVYMYIMYMYIVRSVTNPDTLETEESVLSNEVP